MEQQQMIWLSASLFSSKKNWHRLLSEAIAPFAQNSLLTGYTIEFNHLSGENIRLHLLTEEGNEDTLANAADSHFNTFFKKANLSQLSVKLPVEGIFRPFPGNTIQYGLYPPLVIGKKELDRYMLPISLSKIIVAALRDEIDDETILTFAFYLQISLVKAIYKFTSHTDELFAVITPANVFKADDNTLSNLSLMIEIADDVMQTEEFDTDLNWLNTWIDDCEIALSTVSDADMIKNSIIKNVYQFRIQTVYNHLGINMHGRNMLNYFVIKSLEQHVLVSR